MYKYYIEKGIKEYNYEERVSWPYTQPLVECIHVCLHGVIDAGARPCVPQVMQEHMMACMKKSEADTGNKMARQHIMYVVECESVVHVLL